MSKDEVLHETLHGQTLTFFNSPDLYPVNQYQSLLLATVAEFGALLVASRQKRPIEELTAWEVCCGGGPAAVSLKSLGLKYVQATDINADAVAACERNAAKNGVHLDCLKVAHMLDDGEDMKFDVIACNPPCGVDSFYSTSFSSTAMRAAVLGGDDGMELTRSFLSQARPRLTEKGSLFLMVVSTGDVKSLGEWLNELFPKSWRSFPSTPVAAPYLRANHPRAVSLTSLSESFRPLIWERPDGWFWRLNWVIEVTATPDLLLDKVAASQRQQIGRFVTRPYAYDISCDDSLVAMIEGLADDRSIFA